MQHVRTMTQKCISIDGKLRTKVSTLLQNLLQRLKTLEKYEEFLDKLNLESSKECDLNHGGQQRSDSRSSSNSFHQSTEKSSSSIHHHTSSSTSSVNSISSISSTLSTPDITDLCPSPSVLAHQLTHIELERLSYIGPEEFVQAFAKENPNVDTSIKDMKKTRNLESYVQWFNRLSYIVATEICKHSKKKQRARVIEYWIETARESFNIGNFNTLMAIIAGLNLSPISRLKKTVSCSSFYTIRFLSFSSSSTVGQDPVSQILHTGAPNGSDEQFQQLSINAQGCHVAIRRCYRRAAANCHSILQSTSQGFILPQ